MSDSLLIRPEAEADIRLAYQWYEAQRPGLGEDFALCLEAAFMSIQAHPMLYQTMHKEVRRILVRRFPYGVYYVVAADQITIIAVLHYRRNPQVWRERMK